LLLLVLPLAACSSGETATSASTSTSTSSPSSTTSTSPSLEAGVRLDCLKASLGYIPLKTALTGSDADLISALQFAQAADPNAAGETTQGKAAELALAELGFRVATGHALATVNKPPDRSALQQAYTAAASACQPFGAAF
jgi:hypothetical protein